MLPNTNVVKRLQNLENEIKNVLSIYDVSYGKTKSVKLESASVPPRNKIENTGKTRHHSNYTKPHQTEGISHVSRELVGSNRMHKGGKAKISNEDSARKAESVNLSSSPSAGITFVHNKQADSRLKRRLSTRSDKVILKAGEKFEEIDSEWFDCVSTGHELPENFTKTSESGDESFVNIDENGNKNCTSKINVIICTVCQRANLECICTARCYRKLEVQPDEVNIKQEWPILKHESFAAVEKVELDEYHSKSESDRKRRNKETENVSYVDPTHLIEMNYSQGKILNAASIRHHKVKVKESSSMNQANILNECSEEHKTESGILIKNQCQTSNKNYSPSNYIERPVTASAESENNENRSFTMAHNDRSEIRENQENLVRIEKKGVPARKSLRLDLNKIPEHRLQRANSSFRKAEDQVDRYFRNHSNINRKQMKNSNGSTEVCTTQSSSMTAFNQQGNMISDSESAASFNLTEDLMHIKETNLSDATTRKIAEIIEKNHGRIEEMKKSKHLALSTIKELEAKYNAMAETKMELMEKLHKSQKKNEDLIKELREANEIKQQILIEWENLKQKISDGSPPKKLKQTNEENKELKESIHILEQLQQKVKWINEKSIICNKNSLMDKNKCISQIIKEKLFEYHALHKKQEAKNRTLLHRINSLEKVIEHNIEKEKRFLEMKAEFKKQAVKAKSNMERLMTEKMDLINEMRSCVEEKQTMSENFQELLNKKDKELEKQKLILKQKCETLEETNKELEMIRKNSMDLEEQVKTLRISIENFDQMHQNLLKERQNYEELIQHLKNDNNNLQNEIGNEKDSILIKNKIIEDQQSTIKELKEKSDEMKNLLKKNQSLERIIALEREEKLEMQETIEHLQQRKEELKQKVKALEDDLLLAPQEFAKDLQKTQIVIHELENQVQLKKKEWESHMQSLMREKEQACSVAAFATKKLVQTTSEFQRQSDAHKKLCRLLAENLGQKEKHQEKQMKHCVKFSEQPLHRPNALMCHERMDKNYEEHKKLTKNVTEKFHHYPKQGILKNTERMLMKQDLAEKMQGPNDFIFP